MIEEPALITIHSRAKSVSVSDIEALANFPTCVLADAMNGRGALSPDIRPVHSALPARFSGSALTCHSGPDDVLGLLATLSEIRDGDVLVVATDNWRGSAAVGDRVVGMAKNGGAISLITDGLVRDVLGLVEVGLAVYATGVSPNSPSAKGPGVVGDSVSIGGINIKTNDVVVADEDGVVVVPAQEVTIVIEKAKHIARLETDLDAEVADGLVVPESMVELLKTDQVKRV